MTPLYYFGNTNAEKLNTYFKSVISNKKYEKLLKPLIQNDKIIITLYLRIYETNKKSSNNSFYIILYINLIL